MKIIKYAVFHDQNYDRIKINWLIGRESQKQIKDRKDRDRDWKIHRNRQIKIKMIDRKKYMD